MIRQLLLLFLVGGVFTCFSAQRAIEEQIHSAQSEGRYAEAANLYSRLIAMGTDTPEVRSNYGIMLHLAGNNREALQELKLALRQAPNLVSANLFAGISEVDLGDAKGALYYLKRARELDPGHPAPLLSLGKAYVAVRDYAAANYAYSQATVLDANLAEAWYGVGVTDRTLAEGILNRASRTGKTYDGSVKLKVKNLLDSAMVALTRALQLDPASARTHLLMAESLADSNHFPQAVDEYQAALKLDPGLDAAYLGMASGYWKARQFDKAEPLLQKILVKTPLDSEANGMMADILQQEGNSVEAQRRAEIALAANPDLIQTRVVLARIFLQKQQPALAIAQLRQILSADPDGNYHFLLYRACREAGDQQGARKAMAEFQQIRSNTSH